MFIFDAISSIPFFAETLFMNQIEKLPVVSGWMAVFRVFKLVRLRKIEGMVATMTWSKETKT